MTDAADYYTTRELATHLNIAVKTIQDWRLKGTGPRWFKFGGAVRYRKTEVKTWADAQRAA